MGWVFRACDAELQRTVALKFLQPLEDAEGAPPMELLKQEARGIEQLDHENIVSIFDMDAAPPRPYLIMEYLEGAALSAWVGTPRGA